LIELDGDQVKRIPEDFKAVASRGKTEGKPSIWFESEGCEVCNTILSRDAFLISGKSIEENTIKYSFIVRALSLLYLGITNIRIGPSLPAFITPNILKVLVEKFNIMQITTPEEDLKAIMK